MNPADAVAQAAATPETTLLSMFWSAHIVVKFVMVGLLLSSFWCWTIIINKTLLFARFKRSMNRFEQVFWSGQSLEELYGQLSTQNNTGVASLFVSAMREWKRSFQSAASSFMGLHARLEKVLDVSIAREVERLEVQPVVSGHRRLGGPVRRAVRHGVGHHDGVSLDRRLEKHLARGGCAGYRRGAARHRDRPVRRHSRADRL